MWARPASSSGERRQRVGGLAHLSLTKKTGVARKGERENPFSYVFTYCPILGQVLRSNEERYGSEPGDKDKRALSFYMAPPWTGRRSPWQHTWSNLGLNKERPLSATYLLDTVEVFKNDHKFTETPPIEMWSLHSLSLNWRGLLSGATNTAQPNSSRWEGHLGLVQDIEEQKEKNKHLGVKLVLRRWFCGEEVPSGLGSASEGVPISPYPENLPLSVELQWTATDIGSFPPSAQVSSPVASCRLTLNSWEWRWPCISHLRILRGPGKLGQLKGVQSGHL